MYFGHIKLISLSLFSLFKLFELGKGAGYSAVYYR